MTFQDNIRQASGRNDELLRTLADTDYASARLASQLALIADLEGQIQSNDDTLKRLDGKRRVELAGHEKYRDSNVRRLLFKATGRGNKFTERAKKEEKEYYDVLQEQHEKTVMNENLKHQLQDAKEKKADLEVVDTRHKDAQRELDNLYNSIFAGETTHFPEEDSLERDNDAALQNYHDVRVRWEEEARIVAMLQEAKRQTQVSLNHMMTARTASRMDVMYTYADFTEVSTLTKAEIAYREARGLAERAGFTDLPSVNINQGNFLRDIVFDAMFTDGHFDQEVERGERELRHFDDCLMHSLMISQDRQHAVGEELEEVERGLEQARKRLQDKRAELFERFAEVKMQETAV